MAVKMEEEKLIWRIWSWHVEQDGSMNNEIACRISVELVEYLLLYFYWN